MLISLFASLAVTFASETSDLCAWELQRLPEAAVRETIRRTKLTPGRFAIALDKARIGLTLMKVWDFVPYEDREQLVRNHQTLMTAALSQLQMGYDAAAERTIDRIVKVLNGDLGLVLDAKALRRDMAEVGKRWEVEMTLGAFVMLGASTPETVLFDAVRQRRVDHSPEISVDPRHVELLNIALQYGGTRGENVRVLELNKGEVTPTVPALTELVRKAVVGVDLTALFPSARPGAKPAPYSNYVASLGPFQVVLAFDVLAKGVDLGGVAPVEVARTIRALMRPGAPLIVVNSGRTKPCFTRRQAEKAGFEIVRWADRRSVPAEWRRFLPEDRRAGAGDLTAFVLRTPGLDEARVLGDLTALILPGAK